jgi:hypothetical protein
MNDRHGWFRGGQKKVRCRYYNIGAEWKHRAITALYREKYTTPPAVRTGVWSPLVEAGGQYTRRFRDGLDYAFIRTVCWTVRMRSVLSRCTSGILVPTQDLKIRGESMSLYRAGLRLALFLPLGVAMPLYEESAVRFHRCELRCQPTLTDRRDP